MEDLVKQVNYEQKRLNTSLRWYDVVQTAGWTIAGTLVIGLCAALLSRVTPLWNRITILRMLGISVVLNTVLSVIIGWVWPRPIEKQLRRLDLGLNLADRLTTAWELTSGNIKTSPQMARHLYHETLTWVRAVDANTVFKPYPARAIVIIIAITGLLLMPALWLPNPQEAILAQRKIEEEATAEAIAQLEQTKQMLNENTALTEDQQEQLQALLNEALAGLGDPAMSLEQKQQLLLDTHAALMALQQPEATQQVQQLSEAAPLSTAAIVAPLSKALQTGDLELAAAYLRGLVDDQGIPLTQEETLALADAFNAIADNLQSTNPELAEQFRQIAQETYTGDATGGKKAVEEAANMLEGIAEANAPNQAMAHAQSQLQNAQSQLGQATTGRSATAGEHTTQQQGNAQTGSQGNDGHGTQPGTGQSGNGGGAGQSASQHSEDSGSSAPYGAGESNRLTERGSEITIPRPEQEGQPVPKIGERNQSRIAYQEVYGTYLDAAEADLSRSSYPPVLRQYVQEYFSGLGE